MEEHAALSVLRRWGEMNEFLPGAIALVPEHVEIRSLLNPDKPGLPQVTTTNNNYNHNSNIRLLVLPYGISNVCVCVTGLPSYVGGHVSF